MVNGLPMNRFIPAAMAVGYVNGEGEVKRGSDGIHYKYRGWGHGVAGRMQTDASVGYIL